MTTSPLVNKVKLLMTRKDSELGVNDAEGDRGGTGGCSSRSPGPSLNEGPLREVGAKNESEVSIDDSELGRPRHVVGGIGNVGGVIRKDETKNERRDSTDVVEAAGSGASARQRIRRKMDGSHGQPIDTFVACGTASSTTTGSVIFSTASGSSTPSGETRLTASILFDLPESCGTSASQPMNKMPAITKAQMKEFEEAFNLFDKDRDGSITKEELGRVMRGLGQFARTEELRTMLEEIDTDGDGNVSLVEFVKIVSNIGSASAAAPTDLSQEEQEEQELRDAFRVFDKHNRGYITASDLRAVLQCLGEDLSEEEIEDMIKEVDEDGDGRIDFYEFARSLVDPGSDDEDEEDDDEEIPPSP